MRFLIYSFLIQIYGFAIALVSPLYPKAKQLHQGRKNQMGRISTYVKKWKGKNKIWIHAASYGEYEMAIPIVEALLKSDKNRIFVSFHSPSGYEHTDLEPQGILKIYLPLDTYSKQLKLVQLLEPDKVVFIKYEFWFNLLRVLKHKSIPYYYTSLHLNSNSYLFSPWMRPLTKLIKSSTQIFCHNSSSLAILKTNGFTNVTLLGDTRIQQVKKNLTETKGQITWQNDTWPIVALGSIQPEEFTMVAKLINKHTDKNFLLAPHDIDIATIQKLDSLLNEEVCHFSEKPLHTSRILMVDTIGDLKYLYRNCSVAYVGGGFKKGPHNILEPMIYGIPTCCGPNINKFPMAKQLHELDLLFLLKEKNDLAKMVMDLLNLEKGQYKLQFNAYCAQNENQISDLITELNS